MSELESRLRPGGASQVGFLGDTESLAEVIASDARTLAKLGLTHEQVATALEDLLFAVKQARASLLAKRSGPDGEYFRRNSVPWFDPYDLASLSALSFTSLPDTEQGYLVGRYHVFVTAYRGLQDCPWGCALGLDSCLNLLVLDRATREFFTFPGLSPHLIRTHQFFEGTGTPFRTDPSRVARVLGLAGAG